jgi:hypothetical protein
LRAHLQTSPNRQGFKIGLCNQPPVGLPYSLLALSNNCCITDTLTALQRRFGKLYKRRWVGRMTRPAGLLLHARSP